MPRVQEVRLPVFVRPMPPLPPRGLLGRRRWLAALSALLLPSAACVSQPPARLGAILGAPAPERRAGARRPAAALVRPEPPARPGHAQRRADGAVRPGGPGNRAAAARHRRHRGGRGGGGPRRHRAGGAGAGRPPHPLRDRQRRAGRALRPRVHARLHQRCVPGRRRGVGARIDAGRAGGTHHRRRRRQPGRGASACWRLPTSSAGGCPWACRRACPPSPSRPR